MQLLGLSLFRRRAGECAAETALQSADTEQSKAQKDTAENRSRAAAAPALKNDARTISRQIQIV